MTYGLKLKEKEELKNFLKQHPDIRFIQSLWALNIVDKEEIQEEK